MDRDKNKTLALLEKLLRDDKFGFAVLHCSNSGNYGYVQGVKCGMIEVWNDNSDKIFILKIEFPNCVVSGSGLCAITVIEALSQINGFELYTSYGTEKRAILMVTK